MKKLIFLFSILFIINAKSQIISTIAGNGINGFNGDGGIATAAEFGKTYNVALDAVGNVYIADRDNNRIRKVTISSGIVTTIAGNGGSGSYSCTTCYSGDGGVATDAELNGPLSVALDAAGNLYISDSWNSRIRKVNASTGIITTIAGNGTYGHSGDGGAATAAELYWPTSLAIDIASNIYFIDNRYIRKIDASTGIITTIAGNGNSCSGDGAAALAASFEDLEAIAIDKVGNIYIADGYCSTIRKITASSGIINTIAGNGTYGYSGDGGQAAAAQLYCPDGLAVDSLNNVYIGDACNNRVRKVDVSTGIITTVAGNGAGVGTYTCCYGGDGDLATNAELNLPHGVAFDATGNLYISDTYNNVIRKVCMASSCSAGIEQYNNINNTFKIYPNPTNTVLQVTDIQQQEIKVYNLLGNEVLLSKQNTIDVTNLPNGVYFIKVGNNTQKFIKE